MIRFENNSLRLYCILFLILFVTSCSSSDETTKKEDQKAEDEIYVFDEVPIDDSQPSDVLPPTAVEKDYVIQIGAFSTKQNADIFAQESNTILSEDIKVDYDERLRLFVVTLSRVFNSRAAAANRRDELWKYKEFSDAWLKEVK
jgi:hypothetical protein